MDYSKYDIIIVGTGFFGSVLAERIASQNKKVLIIDKRNHIGGNCYSEDHKETGIHYHKYGTHIFHTDKKHVWEYISRFTEFNGYYHQVLNTYNDKVYQMPINLETINSFYNENLKPYEVDDFLKKEIEKEYYPNPKNFEEKAISLIGRPLYEAFIKGYTKKQWQKDPKDIPESILKRLPFRKNYNESYYFSRWQGMPLNGYTAIFEKMLSHPNIDISLNTDFFDIKESIPRNKTIVYSGPIDQYFNYKFGKLEYRTLVFEEEIVNVEDYQGTSVMNYGNENVPFTRIHEPRHLHIENDNPKDKTLIIKEFSKKDDGNNPYYPINDKKNIDLYELYKKEAEKKTNLIISGRLGDYKYYDMHHTIDRALQIFENDLKNI